MQQKLESALNAPTKAQRLEALKQLMARYHSGELVKPTATENVNNHIHTIYSFSPYSPSGAAYMAWKSGLTTAGIMDHDSVGGAEEFIAAGEIIGIATTVGMECRCSVDGTPFTGIRLNNPDQESVAYMALHGIPHGNIGRVEAFIAPFREQRSLRNRTMTESLNRLLAPCGISLDYDRDIAAISQVADGGSVTERHILFALAGKLMVAIGRGQALLDFLAQKLGITVTGGSRDKLLDEANPMYAYYLLGVLKSQLVEQFYIPATAECPRLADFLALAQEVGGISAYPYLGDIAGSVTGDKKDQTFEDGFLDQLIAYLAGVGVQAVTYMPTRNTLEQLTRVMELCNRYNLFQISGEDINTPFQSFVCESLARPEFRHLITATWALIGHERAATERLEDGMFSAETLEKLPGLQQRIAHFEKLGRGGQRPQADASRAW